METADYDVGVFNARNAGDKSVFAKFYIQPVKDEAKTAEAGRAIYNDAEFVEILVAGDATNMIQRQATDQDKGRFRAAYAAFKEGMADQTIGTPLSEVTWLTKSQVEEMGYLRIRTVESLANLDDGVCGRNPGFYELKRKAAAFIETSEKAAPFTKLQAENDELRSQLESLMVTVKEQTEMLLELKAKK